MNNPGLLKKFWASLDPLMFIVSMCLYFTQSTTVVSSEDFKGVPETLHIAHAAKLIKKRSSQVLSEDEIYNYLKGIREVSSFSNEGYAQFQPLPYNGSDVLFFRATDGYIARNNVTDWKPMKPLYAYIKEWQGLISTKFQVVDTPLTISICLIKRIPPTLWRNHSGP